MSSKRPPRKQVRPVLKGSIAERRFRPVVAVTKRVKLNPVDPRLVAMDLRRGSLASLPRYLIQNQGIPDLEVAQALWAILAGSPSASRYRLMVVEHPDLPKSSGGRPKGKARVSARDQAMHDRVVELSASMRESVAKASVAGEFNVSKRAVGNALSRVTGAQTAAEADKARAASEWDFEWDSELDLPTALNTYMAAANNLTRKTD